MLGLKTRQALIAVFVVTTLVLPASEFAYADSMSSTNYKVQQDVISQGGGNSDSTNYKANDTLGDLSTGENLSSTNYKSCAGFQCFGSNTPYITMSVKEGLTSPGTTGADVALGTLTTSAVTTSDNTTINSIFIATESNANGGTIVTVADDNNGLKRISTADTIASATALLVPGTAGFGICVFSATQGGSSPTTFNAISPYASSCTTSAHNVGLVSTTPNTVLSSTGKLLGGEAEIYVKAAISTTTAAGSDYADTLTFIGTATF
jgi:hypothetical protein